jgi:anti-sigma B factor antagonist
MTSPPAKLSVWVDDQLVCIKIVGRANFTSSVDFKALVSEFLQQGPRCFVLDLSECVLMDSTFLGVLAGFGVKLSGGNGQSARQGIELLNPSDRIIELLETLGVLHLFRVIEGNLAPPAQSPAEERPVTNPSKDEANLTCYQAHRTLMDINPANAARFKDVAQFLAERLKKTGP